jgi:hypothetical protein
MTDRRINDLVSAAAKAHDADFGSPAIYAALKAATDERIQGPDNPTYDLVDAGPDVSGPPLESPYTGPRGPDLPRIPRRFLAAVAAVAFIATCAAGVTLSHDGDASGDPDKAVTTTVQKRTLEQRIVAANRAAYASSIVHHRLTYTEPVAPGDKGSTHDSWTDDTTGARRYRSTALEQREESLQEGPALDEGPVSFDGVDPVGTRTVDHCLSEYADDLSEPTDSSPSTWADELEESLNAGSLVVDGREVVEGRDAIRLRIAPPDPRDGFVWLDATTLLPFRSEGHADSDGAFTETFEFLRRSEENFDLLVPPVPARYTKVDEIPDRNPSAPAGCQR